MYVLVVHIIILYEVTDLYYYLIPDYLWLVSLNLNVVQLELNHLQMFEDYTDTENIDFPQDHVNSINKK